MEYNEKEIKEQLAGLTSDVDTNQLWKDIGPYAPVKREKKLMPLLFMFFLGGVLSASLAYFFYKTPCPERENVATLKVDSLLAENKMLKHKLSLALIGQEKQSQLVNNKKQSTKSIFHQMVFPDQNYIQVSDQKNHPIDSFLNPREEGLKISKSGKERDRENEKLLGFENKSEVIKIDSLTSLSNPEDSIISSNQKSEFSPKIYINPSHESWKFFLGMTMGQNFVKYTHSTDEKIKSASSYQPYLSFSADVGFSKKIKRKFSLGAFINYSNLIYRVNYNRKTVENIGLIDTTEISISSNGSTNVSTGNTGGIKITEQKGKIHGYQHRISLIPTLYFHSLKADKIRLSHQLGLGVDMMSISRDILPTYDESEYIIQKYKSITFNPYVRIGTNLEYYISKDLSASLLLQCAYRNENYNFSLYKGTRSSIFPSVGLGLTFN